jgi:hypothetical protein
METEEGVNKMKQRERIYGVRQERRTKRYTLRSRIRTRETSGSFWGQDISILHFHNTPQIIRRKFSQVFQHNFATQTATKYLSGSQ